MVLAAEIEETESTIHNHVLRSRHKSNTIRVEHKRLDIKMRKAGLTQDHVNSSTEIIHNAPILEGMARVGKNVLWMLMSVIDLLRKDRLLHLAHSLVVAS